MKTKPSVLLFLLLLVFGTQSYAAATLTFAAIENSMNSIVSERVVREAYRRMGIDIVIKPYPSRRSLKVSNAGRTDGELYRIGGMQLEYTNLIQVPVPVNYIEAMFFSRQFNFRVRGWNDLNNYRVGVQGGIKFVEQGLSNTGSAHIHTVNSNEQLFKMLTLDRVDLIVVARLNGLETSQQLHLADTYPLVPPVESYPLYHYLHKKHRDLLPAITKALQTMEGEGMIQKIREQFIAERFE